jgi:hypothetical protein
MDSAENVGRTLLSVAVGVAVDFEFRRDKSKGNSNVNVKSGGQECPPYTRRLAGEGLVQQRLFNASSAASLRW